MRVLLIEDEPTTAKAIELMLTGEGFNVYTTDLGEEGLDSASCMITTSPARPEPARNARIRRAQEIADGQGRNSGAHPFRHTAR